MITKFIGHTGEFHDTFGIKRGNVDVQLRYELLDEELNEYLKAKTFVDKVDAIVDMLYVACGTLDLHGWTENHKRIPYFKFTAKNDSEILNVISKELDRYKTKQEEHKMIAMIHTMLDLSHYNNIYDILPELFDEVHASNMSKLDDNGKPIINDGILDPNKPKGKILKSKNFFEPRLEAILKKHNKI